MKRLSEIHNMNNDIKRLWTETGADRPEQVKGSPISSSTDQDVARLRSSYDELNINFEKANRRINRLLGENKQLSTLLDKRDEKIERLSRELGASESGQRVVAPGNDRMSWPLGSLATVSASVSERIRKLVSKRPEPDNDPVEGNRSPILTANGHSRLIARRKADIGQQVVAVLLFGLARSEIDQLLPIIIRDCSSKRMAPLCLIDMDAFELLRGRGLIFEYLPPTDDCDRFDSTLNWDLYIQRRLALIRRKWDPVRFVAFGSSAMKTLTLWSSSPFEDIPLPVASGTLADT